MSALICPALIIILVCESGDAEKQAECFVRAQHLKHCGENYFVEAPWQGSVLDVAQTADIKH